MGIVEKVKNTILKYKLIKKGDTILVGVSGGPDSLALLLILQRLSQELGFSVYIGHFDHMLRRDSAKDAQFVANLANQFHIPYETGKAGLEIKAKKGSLEEIARQLRQEFLFKVAKRIKADKIALGHNFDDQAETVLMRIIRGTGLYGLAGILPKREISGFIVIRPLLEVTRQEIESYLKRRKITAREDPTNLKETFFRNRIRHTLLPFLRERFNRNIKAALWNLGESASWDYDYLNRISLRYVQLKNKLSIEKLLKMHPAIRRLVIRLEIANVQGDTRRITFKHIQEIEDLLINRPQNSIVNLPKGISVKKEKKYLQFRILANT